jgi:hypothetical protein
MDGIDTFDAAGDNANTRREDDTMSVEALEKSRVKTHDIPEWVTTGQAKRILGVGSINTVKRWIAEGKLEARRFGDRGWIRISGESIKRLLEHGDKELAAIRSLVRGLDKTECLGGDLTDDDMDTLSERRFGKLPWD